MIIALNNTTEKKVVLQMKQWRNHFQDEEIKQLIAIALNKSIYETNIPLKGYFITNWRIYLVIDSVGIEEEEFLIYFLNEFHQMLMKHSVKSHELDTYFKEKEVYKNVRSLFTFYNYFDVKLYHLLTGRKLEVPYDDDVTDKMRTYLSNYNYSSYRNYQGEKGPVIFPVRKKYKRRW